MNKILKHKKLFLTIILIIILFICIKCIKSIKNPNKTAKQTSSIIPSSATNLSNKKIEWGLKKNGNHEPPDFGSENINTLEKNNGIAIGNKDKKYIYLTFDEGYEAGYTPQILKTLKENNVKATFFLTLHYVNTKPELVKQMINENQTIGNHTCKHKSMPSLTETELNDEVMGLHKIVKEKFNYDMKYLRPPKGEFSEKSISITNSFGYKTVMWSFAYADWDEKNQPDKEEAKKKIIENVHNGEIMLLHGNSKTNTEILDEIIKEIKNMGYEFKSLDEFEK